MPPKVPGGGHAGQLGPGGPRGHGCGGPGALKSGKKEGDEHANDGNDNEQLNQSESASTGRREEFKQGTGTFAGTASRVLRATVAVPFLNHADKRHCAVAESIDLC